MGVGSGWTVELKLNRKKEKNGFQRGGGGCDPPNLPLDPLLVPRSTPRLYTLYFYPLIMTHVTRRG